MNGKYVEREMQCDCGTVFTQRQVSRRFTEVFLANENRLRLFKDVSPEGFLPCYCIPCDRKHLGREGEKAQLEEKRALQAAKVSSWMMPVPESPSV